MLQDIVSTTPMRDLTTMIPMAFRGQHGHYVLPEMGGERGGRGQAVIVCMSDGSPSVPDMGGLHYRHGEHAHITLVPGKTHVAVAAHARADGSIDHAAVYRVRGVRADRTLDLESVLSWEGDVVDGDPCFRRVCAEAICKAHCYCCDEAHYVADVPWSNDDSRDAYAV